jgi:hypothetical protein
MNTKRVALGAAAVGAVAVGALAVPVVAGAGPSGPGSTAVGSGMGPGYGGFGTGMGYSMGYGGRMSGVGQTGNAGACPMIDGVAQGTLTEAQEVTLQAMAEEEKLAGDLYQAFADKYSAAVFDRIGAAEDQHLATVRALLDRYGLNDPTAGKGRWPVRHGERSGDVRPAAGAGPDRPGGGSGGGPAGGAGRHHRPAAGRGWS